MVCTALSLPTFLTVFAVIGVGDGLLFTCARSHVIRPHLVDDICSGILDSWQDSDLGCRKVEEPHHYHARQWSCRAASTSVALAHATLQGPGLAQEKMSKPNIILLTDSYKVRPGPAAGAGANANSGFQEKSNAAG